MRGFGGGKRGSSSAGVRGNDVLQVKAGWTVYARVRRVEIGI